MAAPLLLLEVFLLAAGLALAQHPHRHRLTTPGTGLHHLRQYPARQREHMLKQNPDFQRLPPHARQQMMVHLRHLNAMPAGKQQRLERRLRAFGQLSPEQRSGLRQVYQKFRAMPASHQIAFRNTYNALLSLNPAERAKCLADPALQQALTQNELSALRLALALNLPGDLVGSGKP